MKWIYLTQDRYECKRFLTKIHAFLLYNLWGILVCLYDKILKTKFLKS
jgi:hypothetical protein